MLNGDIIADVGSDHAYLPVWLYFNKKIKKAYALDISENCVERIRANIKRYKIPEDIIIPVLSDGLDCFEKNFDFSELTDIIIAGMGGETIAAIIEKTEKTDKNKIKGKNFILQANSKIITLRKFLHKNNFGIVRETVVECKKRFYTIINARFDIK